AESGSGADTGRHRLPSRHAEAVVTGDTERANPTTRRLAPLAVGAVVSLVATLVATFAQSPGDPSLAAQELSHATTQAAQAPPPEPAPEPPPEPTPEPTPEPSPQAQAAAAPAETKAERKAESAERKAEGGAQAAAPRKSGGEGRSAAAVHGWTRVGGDEFDGGL